MIRLFKHYVPHWVLLLGALDVLLLLGAGEAGWLLRAWQIGGAVDPETGRLPNLFIYAGAIQLAMVSVGLYRSEALLSIRVAVARLLVALALGILFLSVVFFLLPTIGFWRSNLLYATLITLGALAAVRAVLSRAASGDTFKRRVLVLGAGARAGRIDLDSLNPSWLIFSDGFSAGRRLSSIAKRVFDILVSSAILILTAPLIVLTAIAVKLESKGPAFFRQRRVGLYGVPFEIPKLRLMREDAEVGGKAVWAQKDDPRVTRVGHIIRKLRIDELPQAWSVLKGDMSF